MRSFYYTADTKSINILFYVCSHRGDIRHTQKQTKKQQQQNKTKTKKRKQNADTNFSEEFLLHSSY